MHEFDMTLLANKYKTKSKFISEDNKSFLSDVLNEHLEEVTAMSTLSFDKNAYGKFLREYLKEGLRIFSQTSTQQSSRTIDEQDLDNK